MNPGHEFLPATQELLSRRVPLNLSGSARGPPGVTANLPGVSEEECRRSGWGIPLGREAVIFVLLLCNKLFPRAPGATWQQPI